MKPSTEPPARPVIPDHQIIRLIGEGSCGQIWLAKNVIGTPRAGRVMGTNARLVRRAISSRTTAETHSDRHIDARWASSGDITFAHISAR